MVINEWTKRRGGGERVSKRGGYRDILIKGTRERRGEIFGVGWIEGWRGIRLSMNIGEDIKKST